MEREFRDAAKKDIRGSAGFLSYFEIIGEFRIQCGKCGQKQAAALTAHLSSFRTFLHSAYNEVVDDLWHYLRDEKGVAEPQQYLCVPMR